MLLMIIGHSDQPLTLDELAVLLSCEPQGVSALLVKMERSGLIQRTRALNDKRRLRIRVTERGRESFEQSSRVGAAIRRRAFAALDPEQLLSLVGLLESLRNAAMKEIGIDPEESDRLLVGLNEDWSPIEAEEGPPTGADDVYESIARVIR